MFSLSQDFHRARRERNLKPEIIFTLVNAYGARVYSNRQPSQGARGLSSPPLGDGTFLADGSCTGGEGSLNVLDWGARVLGFGRLRETLTPVKGDILASFNQEEPGNLTLVLSNGGPSQQRPCSRLEALENLLGATGYLAIGYPGVKPREFLTRFQGQVDSYKLEAERLTLTLRA
ncbi:MAG: hypothetical protein PVG03_01095 [Desulfarculaceae bacterium]|jgi:hypothetical protein